jgi:para-aminobenzoate synthetase component 1
MMRALFPCGSVTGAPKIRAMEVIREVEPSPRGVYCGAVGWMAPDGTADFSVAIRTLSIRDERVVMNVGGGVVIDSTAAGEWEEALWKARFVKAAVTRT